MLHVDYNKVYACCDVKMFKNEPLKKSNRGARAWCASAGSAFGHTQKNHRFYTNCRAFGEETVTITLRLKGIAADSVITIESPLL